jgi:hypothetical protein
MDLEEIVRKVELAWSSPSGSLFQLRGGTFDRAGLNDLLHVLRQVEVAEDLDVLPRRLVSLLWYMPLFIQWQKERV